MRVICVGNLECLLNDLKQKNMRTMLWETGMNCTCISELLSDMFGRFPSGCHYPSLRQPGLRKGREGK